MNIYNQIPHIQSTETTQQNYLAAIRENLQQLLFTVGKKNIYAKPWYLVIGPKSSGKTALLQHADIAYSHKLGLHNPFCSTYVSEHAVYFDVNGELFSTPIAHSIWPALYQAFKDVRKKLPLNGIIMVLDLTTVSQHEKLTRHALNNDYLTAIKKFTANANRSVPLYIVFSHLDQLNGFVNYFDNLDKEERAQCCGFILPAKLDANETELFLIEKFQNLISVLHNNLITRLHQIQNKNKRAVVNEFPSQLENMSDVILETVKFFCRSDFHHQKHIVRGVFFTSSQQGHETVDPLAASIKKAFAISTNKKPALHIQERPFFTKLLLSQTIPGDYKFIEHMQNHKFNTQHLRKPATIIALVATTALVFAGMTKIFVADAHLIAAANQAMTEYQLAQRNSTSDNNEYQKLSDGLLQLSILTNAKRRVEENRFAKFSIYPNSQLHQAAKRINDEYHTALTQNVLPKLTRHVGLILQRQNRDDPKKLYAALKAYLMLGNPEHMQRDYFISWLHTQPVAGSKAHDELFVAQLASLLRDKLPAADLDMDVVTETRSTLNSLPKSFLAYLTLRDDSAHQPVSLHELDELFVFKINYDAIPYIYTKAGFIEAYQHTIPNLATQVFQGDWVLGKFEASNTNDKHHDITKELQQLYVSDYVNWWNSLLRGVYVKPAESADDVRDRLESLAESKSSLERFYQIIAEHTQAISDTTPVATVFNQQIANHFYNIRNMPPALLPGIKATCRELARQFTKIDKTNNTDHAALQIAKHYFQETGSDPFNKMVEHIENSPEPISQWLSDITNSAWYVVAAKTQNHINQEWSAQIIPEYRANIANHYPLEKEAASDIQLNHFQHFFGPSGSLDNYFKDNIEPFVDMSQATWTAKSLNGLKLSLSEEALQQFIHANLIRKMFFYDNRHLAVPFSLTATTLLPSIKSVTVNVNGTEIVDQQGKHERNAFIWPGVHPADTASIAFDQKLALQKSGPWAWFRLLEDAAIRENDRSGEFDVVFITKDRHAVKYRLVAASAINPFVPGVLENLKLPSEIS